MFKPDLAVSDIPVAGAIPAPVATEVIEAVKKIQTSPWGTATGSLRVLERYTGITDLEWLAEAVVSLREQPIDVIVKLYNEELIENALPFLV